jgi:signal peptidase II
VTEEDKSEKAGETGADDGAEPAEPEKAETEKADGGESSESSSEKASTPPASLPKPNYTFLAVASAIGLVADLGTKEWAAKRLEDPMAPPIKVIEGIEIAGTTYALHFDLAKNKGGAWGVLGEQPDYVRLPFFFIISALAVVFIVGLYRKLEPHQWALKWALPLVLAGAIGNLVDRIRHQHVIDFIDAFMIKEGRASHWPTFNVADIWIVAGVILMGIDWFTPNRTPKPKRERRAVRVRG